MHSLHGLSGANSLLSSVNLDVVFEDPIRQWTPIILKITLLIYFNFFFFGEKFLELLSQLIVRFLRIIQVHVSRAVCYLC